MTTWIWPASGQGGGGGGGAAAAPVARRMDASLFGGAVAAWAPLLALAGGNIDVDDYTSNGHGLVTPNALTALDLIPNRAVWSSQMSQGGIYTAALPQVPSPVNLGDWSLVARITPTKSFTPLDNWVYARGDYSKGVPAGNTTASILFGSSAGSHPRYYHRGVVAEITWDFLTLAYPGNGLNHFLAVMRDSVSVPGKVIVTCGVDGVFETSDPLDPPFGGVDASDNLGGHLGTSQFFQGSVPNALIYASCLTQAQTEVFRKQAMGLV